MKTTKSSSKELMQLWENFKIKLENFKDNETYCQQIRQKGFEVNHMIFVQDEIQFSIQTTFDILIPYTILAGGYRSCMDYINNELTNFV